MSKKKAVFLDLFGTLIEDHGSFESINDVIFKSGALDFLKIIEYEDFLIFISIFREVDEVPDMKYIESLQDKILNELITHGVDTNSISFLSNIDSEQSDLHPLTPTFIRTLEKDYKLNLSESLIVGDLMQDVKIGKTVNLKTVLLSSPDDSPWVQDVEWLEPDFMVENLIEAADKIAKM